jgi:multimeric flavodoxin WrbA
MKIVILDGQPNSAHAHWQSYLLKLSGSLEALGHQVRHFVLKDMKIHHCQGCFTCWLRTPGLCVHRDDASEINDEVINADFVLWASPLLAGFPSSILKKALDRTIPLVHPYFEIVNGEFHHMARYPKYPLVGLLIEPTQEDGPETLPMLAHLFSRNALNFKTRLCFAETTHLPANELTAMICHADRHPLEVEFKFKKMLPASIQPPRRLIAINGSPRGEQGNTPILLQKIMDGFSSMGSNQARMFHLSRNGQNREWLSAIQDADCLFLGFPLYTDAMPGIVKEFIEMIYSQRDAIKIPMGFEIHSGFPEASQSRYVEQYLMALTERLNCPYLGTVIHGSGEGIRSNHDRVNRRLFSQYMLLGSQLAKKGYMNQQLITHISGVERYPKSAGPFLKLLNATVIKSYWDVQLKENGVYQDRFAQPYLRQQENILTK